MLCHLEEGTEGVVELQYKTQFVFGKVEDLSCDSTIIFKIIVKIKK